MEHALRLYHKVLNEAYVCELHSSAYDTLTGSMKHHRHYAELKVYSTIVVH